MKTMFKYICLSFFLSVVFTSHAQDSKITAGIVMFNQGKLPEAIKKLEEGLSFRGKVKLKNQIKGNLYLSKACYDQMLIETEAQPKYDHLIKSIDALTKAYEADSKQSNKELPAHKEKVILYGSQQAVVFLNYASSNRDDALQRGIYSDEAIKLCSKMLRSAPGNYLLYDLMGQGYLNKTDTVKAKKSFVKCTSAFAEDRPEMPDQLNAYVHYRLAVIYSYHEHDDDKALAAVQSGLKVLNEENDRVQSMTSFDTHTKSIYNTQYEQIFDDLSKYELNIYQHDPRKREEGLKKFEAALEREPDNYYVRVAYARLLEDVDFQKSVDAYKKATEVDPSKKIAFFNLGAIYTNRAVMNMKLANNTDDELVRKKYESLYEKDYAQAKVYFEKIYALDPCDKEALYALVNQAARENNMSDYKKYKDARDSCTE